MLVIEIQRGKDPMRLEEYSKEYGSTAGCTFRLAEKALHSGAEYEERKEALEDRKAESFYGDSWFSSVTVCDWLASKGMAYVGALKTSHRFFPKDDLESVMKAWPSGSYLVMECTTPKKGNKLLAIGYRYNAKKTLCFVATKSAGSTKPGEPYIASFPDKVGNVHTREVLRPSILSDYFGISNAIDSHNQCRQHELGLERLWITQDAYFRVDTTILGITVTDAWRAYKYGVANERKKEITICEFADRLASDCIHNELSDIAGGSYLAAAKTAAVGDGGLPLSVNIPRGDGDGMPAPQLSPVTVASSASLLEGHSIVETEEKTKKGDRKQRRTCRAPDCRKKTLFMCGHRQCRKDPQDLNGKIVYGVYYCPTCFHTHTSNVLKGEL